MIEHTGRRWARRRLVVLLCLLLCVWLAVPLRAVAQTPSEAPPAPVSLEVGVPVERTLTSNVTLSFSIALSAGDFLSVVARDHGIASECTLRDPSGAVALRSWEVLPNQTGRTNVEYVVESAGVYVLSYALAPPPTGAPVSFEVELAAVRPATAVDRERAAAYRQMSEGIRGVEEAPQTIEARTRGVHELESAVARYRALGDARHEMNALHELANGYSTFGDHIKTVRTIEEAIAIARTLGDDEKLASLLVERATCQQVLGEPKPGDVTLDEAFELFARSGVGEGYWQWSAYKVRGQCRRDLGDARAARESFERAKAMGERIGLGPNSVLYFLAQLDYTEGRVPEALAGFNVMAAEAEKRHDPVALCRALGLIGSVRGLLGDWQGSVESSQRALSVAREFGYAFNTSLTLLQLSTLYVRLGELDEAMRCLDECRQLSLTNGHIGLVYFADLGLGNLHLLRGEPREALESYRSAEVRAEAESLNMMEIRVGYGQAYEALGDAKRADDAFERALGSVDAQTPPGSRAALWLACGTALAKRDPAKAGPLLERALEIVRSSQDRSVVAAALYELARIDRDAGRLASAKERIREAIGIAETLRNGLKSPEFRTSYFAKVRSYYDLYTDVLMREGGTASVAEAFAVAERGRGRVLLETLSERGVDLAAGVDPRLRSEEHEARGRLIGRLDYQVRLLGREHTPEEAEAVAREITELEGRLVEAEGRLRAASPAYAALTSPEPVTAGALQRDLLDADTALIAYDLGEDVGYMWAVTTEGVTSARLPGRGEIEQRVRRLRQAVAARACAPKNEAADERDERLRAADTAYRREARGLGDEILKPVARAIAGKRLAIVPDGALALVPFGALVEPGTGRHVIEGHEVVTLPSATALRSLRDQEAKRAEPEGMIAVVADPVFDALDERVTTTTKPDAPKVVDMAGMSVALRAAGAVGSDACGARAGLERLRGSAREAAAIAALAPRDERLEALGFAANLDLATSGELGKYRIVHFATHGYVPSGAPELSGLVLSLVDERGRERPGYLGMPQIYAMRLPVETVVLSACETGLGREVSGEGVIGLVRGFMYAGSSRVVSSLWKIDDTETAGLMAELYAGMLKRGRTPTAALREAQLKLIEEGKSPYVWGAFQLAGEWR